MIRFSKVLSCLKIRAPILKELGCNLEFVKILCSELPVVLNVNLYTYQDTHRHDVSRRREAVLLKTSVVS